MAQAKRLRPIDDAVRVRLAEAAVDSSLGQAQIGQLSGMSQNRVGIILRGETPPATVGEICAMSGALGVDPVEVIREAEEAVAAGGSSSPSVIDGGAVGEMRRADDDLPDMSMLAARRVASRLGWEASRVGEDAGEEAQG